MQTDEYGRLFEHEDHYWWFVARRRLALRLLDRALSGVERPSLLDMGCGTGAVLGELDKRGWAAGLDASPLALEFCAKRGMERLVLGDGEQLPFREGAFDGVVALDIFEHIADDARAFGEAHRVLKPNGVLVLSVPAFRWLWGPHDVALMHHRRYTRRVLGRRLRAAGFRLERLSYSVFFLFPAVVAVRIRDKFARGPAKVSLPPVPDRVNRALVRLHEMETGLLTRVPLPWGSSVVAVARRR